MLIYFVSRLHLFQINMSSINTHRKHLVDKVFTKVSTGFDFSALALELFAFQYKHNNVYKSYVDLLKVKPEKINRLEDIPFLPIQLFKSNKVVSGKWDAKKIFKSSSTTGLRQSITYVKDLLLYQKNAKRCFESQYGLLENFEWYALLPSYLEQGESSLVEMAAYFMNYHPKSKGGFYMNDLDKLLNDLQKESSKQKILLGVSYALLDLAENYKPDLSSMIVIETGGMKGRGKELPRAELYEILKENFNLSSIHSEYGMTELFSQAYSQADGLFEMSPSMKIMISDLNDPFSFLVTGKQGKINIIDLANIDTCCFIATDDLGIITSSHKFRVLGRTDASETRGCNLLYTM